MNYNFLAVKLKCEYIRAFAGGAGVEEVTFKFQTIGCSTPGQMAPFITFKKWYERANFQNRPVVK